MIDINTIVQDIMSASRSPGDNRPATVQEVDYGTSWPAENATRTAMDPSVQKKASDLLAYESSRSQQDLTTLYSDFPKETFTDSVQPLIQNFEKWNGSISDDGNGLRLSGRLAQGVVSGWSLQDAVDYFTAMQRGWDMADNRNVSLIQQGILSSSWATPNPQHVELNQRIAYLTSLKSAPSSSPFGGGATTGGGLVTVTPKGGGPIFHPIPLPAPHEGAIVPPTTTAPAPTSTGTKVAAGAAGIGVLGFVGLAWWGWSQGLTIQETIHRLFGPRRRR